jgi:hypothetical protein
MNTILPITEQVIMKSQFVYIRLKLYLLVVSKDCLDIMPSHSFASRLSYNPNEMSRIDRRSVNENLTANDIVDDDNDNMLVLYTQSKDKCTDDNIKNEVLEKGNLYLKFVAIFDKNINKKKILNRDLNKGMLQKSKNISNKIVNKSLTGERNIRKAIIKSTK